MSKFRCKKCGSRRVTKAGVKPLKSGWYQRLFCKSCRSYFRGPDNVDVEAMEKHKRSATR